MLRRTSCFAAAALSALVLSSAVALAEPTPVERAAARTLFDDARRLMAQGSFAVACPKLEESQRIDPGIGTQFNLAECQEKIGKVASAWENFLEVANSAKNAGQSAREGVARARAAALAPKIGKLVVTVDPKAGDVTIKRDGVEIDKPLWGTPVPVDPGDHEIVASAQGKLPFKKTVSVPPGSGTISFTVPTLADAPPDALVEVPVDAGAKPNGMRPRRLAGIVVGAVGVVTLGAGGLVGLAAKGKANDSNNLCDPQNPNSCTPAGKKERDDAIGLGNVATVVVIAGGVVAAAGVVLFVTAPSSSARTTGLAVGPGSISLRGTF